MFILEVEAYSRKLTEYIIIFHRPDKSFHLLKREAQIVFPVSETVVSQTSLGP
jgi:hypothetical protein